MAEVPCPTLGNPGKNSRNRKNSLFGVATSVSIVAIDLHFPLQTKKFGIVLGFRI